jgi:hypothetical protein
MPEGRVLIAPNDGPLEPSPTWERMDAPGGDFPDSFVAGFDTKSGKQTLLSQTDTGTATVYCNDQKYGLLDPRNSGSLLHDKLIGKQILLQLYDPVRETWNPQFRGVMDIAGYVLGPDTDAQGVPVNATVQLGCVDAFAYLAGFGLTPGLAGDRPPHGGDDGVWYAQQASDSLLDDRIIQIYADVGIPESPDPMTWGHITFSGNVIAQTVKYDPDSPALNALRDCADAEFPFISSLYVDRFGRPIFHGRYGRFEPFGLSAHAGPDRWDFHLWKLGDGVATVAESDRVQMRVLEFEDARNNIVNVAVCYPQGTQQDQMPSQIYADTASINQYGHYAAPPMSDLLTQYGQLDGVGRYVECFRFAKLLVKNQKDPRETVTQLQVKAVHPLDRRAPNVWECLTKADVSDMVNLRVQYPGTGGVGMTGASPDDDYFLEGRQMRVRPMSSDAALSALPGYDYVELDLQVSPAVWSQDTHSVFPPWPGTT